MAPQAWCRRGLVWQRMAERFCRHFRGPQDYPGIRGQLELLERPPDLGRYAAAADQPDQSPDIRGSRRRWIPAHRVGEEDRGLLYPRERGIGIPRSRRPEGEDSLLSRPPRRAG